MREVLVDKQGNFGSIAGLPPAAMRYTEARLSQAAGEMLADLDYDTVDFTQTYDQEREEPGRPSLPLPEPAGQRFAGNCGRYGDQHPPA